MVRSSAPCRLLGIGLIAATLGCGSTDDQKSVADTTGNRGNDAGAGLDGGTNIGNDLPAWPDGKYIGIDALYQRVQAEDPEMLLLNVSDEEFYDMGHIEGSLKIPWDLLDGRADEVDSGKHVVIYCRRGVRSENAYDTLTARDYPLVWVMEGGLEQWIADGYPTVPE